jgi:hypothetical protein
MAVTRIRKSHFSGGSYLFGTSDKALSSVLRKIVQFQAATVVAALGDLTDNGGGTAGTMAKAARSSGAVLVGTTGAQKAAFEAAMVTVKNAITELAAQVLTIVAVAPVTDAVTNSVGGTAADGTIAAITTTLTGVNTSVVPAAGYNTLVDAYNNAFAQLTYYVNAIAEAVGLTKLSVAGLGGLAAYSTTFAALATSVGTATTISAGDGVSAVEAAAALVVWANNVKTLSTKLNAATAQTVPALQVVAAPG